MKAHCGRVPAVDGIEADLTSFELAMVCHGCMGGGSIGLYEQLQRPSLKLTKPETYR